MLVKEAENLIVQCLPWYTCNLNISLVTILQAMKKNQYNKPESTMRTMFTYHHQHTSRL